MKGDPLLEQIFDFMELRKSLEKSLVRMEMLLNDRANSGRFTACQKVPLDFRGIDFTVLAAKDKEEGGELLSLQEEIKSVIHLMQKGLGTDLSFHGPLFTG